MKPNKQFEKYDRQQLFWFWFEANTVEDILSRALKWKTDCNKYVRENNNANNKQKVFIPNISTNFIYV